MILLEIFSTNQFSSIYDNILQCPKFSQSYSYIIWFWQHESNSIIVHFNNNQTWKKQLLIDVLFLYLLCCIIDKTVIFCIYHRYQMLCTVSLVHNSIWPTNYIIISLQMDGSLAFAPYMKIFWIEYDMSKNEEFTHSYELSLVCIFQLDVLIQCFLL